MKKIVDDAKPAATRALQLESTTFSPPELDSLARWLALAALIRDFKAKAHPEKISKGDRDFFFAHRRPPDTWYVGIGAYSGERTVNDRAQVTAFRNNAPPHDIISAVHVCTWTVGGLLALVHVSAPNLGSPEMLQRDMYRDCLTQIWPATTRSLGWPNYARRVLSGYFVDGVRSPVNELATRADRMMKKVAADNKGTSAPQGAFNNPG